MSYANPSTRLEEQIETYTLGFKFNRRKRKSYHNISAIRYRIDNTSTASYIFDRLSAGAYVAAREYFSNDSTALAYVYDRYASRLRFGHATGFDLRAESRTNISLTPRLNVDLGGQFQNTNAIPYLGHYSRPVEGSFLSLIDPDSSFFAP